MTPEERAAEFARLTAELDTVMAEIATKRDVCARRQVELDNLTVRYNELRAAARKLVPRDPATMGVSQ